MIKACQFCQNDLEITNEDLSFLDRISPIFNNQKYQIPTPTLCPTCRQIRRLSFRNERKLYHRKCDLTGKEIISIYSPNKPYKVFSINAWWNDDWNGLNYGQDFDFSKPFFEQFNELLLKVPRIALMNQKHENSEYACFALENKNSYLLFTSAKNENCYYSNRIFNSKDLCDTSNIIKSELCYEIIDSDNCYNSTYLQNCSNCSDCHVSYNLKSCKNCVGCTNLINEEYCIWNQKYDKENYLIKKKELINNTEETIKLFNERNQTSIRKYIDGVNLENCSGNSLSNCKNSHYCYEAKSLEDCKYVCNATNMNDSRDLDNDDNSELIYEAIGSESSNHTCFNDICWHNNDIFYNSLCFHSNNLFGCVGLKNKKYCILNKQYTKDEYEKLVPKIIEHMQSTGEFGEFFPSSISPFGYNETIANDYYPLERDYALSREFKWEDKENKGYYDVPTIEIPEKIEDVPDSICTQILKCKNSGKPYKIIPQELAFYRKIKLPVPKICPDERHKNRMLLRNPRKLYNRECMKCKKEIQTTYSPDRKEIVYCESCYLSEVY